MTDRAGSYRRFLKALAVEMEARRALLRMIRDTPTLEPFLYGFRV